MWMFALGIVAVVLKLTGLTMVAAWPWWVVVAPFVAAALWWTIADVFGITRRNAMRRHEETLARRRAKQRAALGMSTPGSTERQVPGGSHPDRSDRRDH
jgi:small Trp-rich protein